MGLSSGIFIPNNYYGFVTILALRTTAVCASALPFMVAPV